MAKHRKEGPTSGVMVCPIYIGTASKERIGKAIITEDHETVLVFDHESLPQSVRKLLEPTGGLPLTIDTSYTEWDISTDIAENPERSFREWYLANQNYISQSALFNDYIADPKAHPTLF